MSTTAQPIPDATLKNLQAAFNGESNAGAKYAAFATQADEEGYRQAASLFRAASRAEKIHATNHAAVIKKLGGAPAADIHAPEIKTTADNLKAAIAGEEYERDVMYPEFIEVARTQNQVPAERTFRFALAAEAEHARMYTEALANLEKMTHQASYHVCPICGYTTLKLSFDRCPVCQAAKEKFETVN